MRVNKVRSARQNRVELNLNGKDAKISEVGGKKQSSKLRIALALLVLALAAVLVRDREFWLGPDDAPIPDAALSQSVPAAGSPAEVAKTEIAKNEVAKEVRKSVAPAAPSFPVTNQAVPNQTVTNQKANHNSAPAAVAKNQDAAKIHSPIIPTKRTALPPLEVQVIAKSPSHHARAEAAVGKKAKSEPNETTQVGTLPTNATEKVSLTSEAAPELRQTIDSTYPLLGPRMSVQGAVVLQAVIGADGAIENLRVISGPAILTTAATQAVREWHFKPYLQHGEAVETKATITVNFSIRVSENSAKTS
ncbi:MAG TPA: TonB family protein [Candidatus Sulfotelmatobacter sp.]